MRICQERSHSMLMVALLRGINVGGNRKISMPGLRGVAEEIGLRNVKTYIQSGNLVFDAGRADAPGVTLRLEEAIEKRFGFAVDVIVRSGTKWREYAKGAPFADAVQQRPNL